MQSHGHRELDDLPVQEAMSPRGRKEEQFSFSTCFSSWNPFDQSPNNTAEVSIWWWEIDAGLLGSPYLTRARNDGDVSFTFPRCPSKLLWTCQAQHWAGWEPSPAAYNWHSQPLAWEGPKARLFSPLPFSSESVRACKTPKDGATVLQQTVQVLWTDEVCIPCIEHYWRQEMGSDLQQEWTGACVCVCTFLGG